MGCNKALLKPFGQNGASLIENAFNIASHVAERCFVCTAPDRNYPGFPCIPDEMEGKGPIGGIVAGLRHVVDLGYAGALVLPCDMPLLDVALLRHLLEMHILAQGENMVTMFYSPQTGRREMTVAVYSALALPLLEKALAVGHCALWRVFSQAKQCSVPYGEEDAGKFINLNTREDYDEFMRA